MNQSQNIQHREIQIVEPPLSPNQNVGPNVQGVSVYAQPLPLYPPTEPVIWCRNNWLKVTEACLLALIVLFTALNLVKCPGHPFMLISLMFSVLFIGINVAIISCSCLNKSDKCMESTYTVVACLVCGVSCCFWLSIASSNSLSHCTVSFATTNNTTSFPDDVTIFYSYLCTGVFFFLCFFFALDVCMWCCCSQNCC